jgi:hypothetical protein
MDAFVSLFRLALERGWALGLLCILFFGSALLADSHSLLGLPPVVVEWAAAGVLFGAATTIVSLLAQLFKLASSIFAAGRERAESRAEDEREGQEAIANSARWILQSSRSSIRS